VQTLRSHDRDTIVITPDGPRGPRHRYKRGAFLAARELDLPIFHLHLDYTSRRTLKSWDKFEVPMPFSKVTIRAERIKVNEFPMDKDAQHQWLEDRSKNEASRLHDPATK
jgi:lysophospholipid acyltransferase (LPLAT)-like uncharacterized protein